MNLVKSNILKIFKKEPETLNELAQCVIAVIEKNNVKVLGFQWDIKFGDVPNTHHSPVGFPLNWGRERDKPLHYPGWRGRVWIRYDTHLRPRSFGSDPFRETLTHTGTGGYGSYDGPWNEILNSSVPKIYTYSWDYLFFQSDWPELERQEQLICALHGEPYIGKHFFSWTDPETKRKDEELIQECNNLKVRT